MEFLTKQQAAHYFGVSERTLERWEKSNILKPVSRINGRPRYSKQNIEQLAFNLVNSSTRKTTM